MASYIYIYPFSYRSILHVSIPFSWIRNNVATHMWKRHYTFTFLGIHFSWLQSNY